MRIGNDHLIQYAREVAARSVQRERAAAADVRDVVAVESKSAEARAADMDVRQTQNTMTLFRIAEDALTTMENAAARFAELAGEVASGVLSPAELNTAAIEAQVLTSAADAAARRATMGGVPLFGARQDTETMWSIAAGNASALGTSSQDDDIEGISKAANAAASLVGAKITDADAMTKGFSAAETLTSARKLMQSQAVKVGYAALDLTADAIDSLSTAAKAGDPNAQHGLLKFVMENADIQMELPSAGVSLSA